MPVDTENKGGKWRIVDSDGTITKNKSGTPVDGKGHDTKNDAVSQVRAINLNMRRNSSIEDRFINCLALKLFKRR